MAQYMNFQLSLELTNLIPIKDLVVSRFSKVLDYARGLRRSGSDIVVESDLAIIFGQVRVDPRLEEQFKTIVRQTRIVATSENSQLTLAHGAGPTMTNAFSDQALLATMIQLSMLAFFQNRVGLANALADTMNQRFKAGIKYASPDPGIEGISNTLKACSSQSSSFEWHALRDTVLRNLRAHIPEYDFSLDYMLKISPSILLALMDMLSIVQRFPEERRITVSNDTGCLAIIMWAHCIAGLTVSVVTRSGKEAKFGNADKPNLIISSSLEPRDRDTFTPPPIATDPVVRMHEKDMSVIFECQPSEKSRIPIRVEDRHPLGGYGTEFLKREFNRCYITPNDDPIYAESSLLIAALAIQISSRLRRDLRIRPQDQPASDGDNQPKFVIETWRILDAASLFFEGLTSSPIDLHKLENYVQYLQRGDPLKHHNLPSSFDNFIQKHKLENQEIRIERWVIGPIYSLAQILVFLSCANDIESCKDAPLLLNIAYVPLLDVPDTFADFPAFIPVKSHTIIHGIAGLLLSTTAELSLDEYDKKRADNRLISLYSDFGWSVFLDTLTNKDACAVRLEIVHLKQGTPMKESTGERRFRIRDGIHFPTLSNPGSCPLERGGTYRPRCAASVSKREEEWVTVATEFEGAIYLTIDLSSEWLAQSDVNRFEAYLAYREMHECLWNATITPSCQHRKAFDKSIPYQEDQKVKLGPSAATMLGWFYTSVEAIHEKVLISLTRGCFPIRWDALRRHTLAYNSEQVSRRVLLVPGDCCEECALIFAASHAGDSALIL